MIFKTLCTALCVGLLGAFAAADDTLKIVTYNVQFLPGLASMQNERREPAYRARRIVEELKDFDIVALQEVFHVEHKELILDGFREAWGGELNVVQSPHPDDRMTSGGCLILTRLPIIQSNSCVYEHFSKPSEYGVRADGFAAKGAIHGRIARNAESLDDYIDVFVTHLEARADHLRPEQYKELAAFIGGYSSADHPALLLGDLNTNGVPEYRESSDSQYGQLMAALDKTRPGGFEDLWVKLMGGAHGGTTDQESAETGKRIDYVLMGKAQGAVSALVPQSIRVEMFRDEKVHALSDHNAVVAEFIWGASD
ncbi:MAG: endonuclease/exonuclease/phosphatase family protein [Candidatus Hydrogenedentes bacterium]|nr:endonuclease/exonuclease/phosphatase family protein [Candidatus Hydrogenedentota bacterium]